MLFKRKKKEQKKWDLDEMFDEEIEYFKQNRVWMDNKQRTEEIDNLLKLGAQKMEFEEKNKVQKDKVPKSQWASIATVILLAGLPYLIEEKGKLARHFKDIPKPKLFK